MRVVRVPGRVYVAVGAGGGALGAGAIEEGGGGEEWGVMVEFGGRDGRLGWGDGRDCAARKGYRVHQEGSARIGGVASTVVLYRMGGHGEGA